jgi:hypothetical protein
VGHRRDPQRVLTGIHEKENRQCAPANHPLLLIGQQVPLHLLQLRIDHGRRKLRILGIRVGQRVLKRQPTGVVRNEHS